MKLTRKAIQKWIRNSAITCHENLPLVVYHGTFHDFEQFDIDKSTEHGFMGRGIYFTSSHADAWGNYANLERIKKLAGEDAIKSFHNNGVVISAYLRIENPLYIGGKTPTVFNIQDGSLHAFINAFRTAHLQYPTVPLDGVEYMAKTRFLQEAGNGNGTLTAADIISLIQRQLALDPTMFGLVLGEALPNHKMSLLQATWIRLGFDGIIDKASIPYFKKKGMVGLNVDTFHCAVFHPKQIKIVAIQSSKEKLAA